METVNVTVTGKCAKKGKSRTKRRKPYTSAEISPISGSFQEMPPEI